MDRVILILIVFIGVGAVMSYLLSRYFIRKVVWYLPSIIGVLIVIYFSLKIEFVKMEGFVELGYLLNNFMILAVVIGNIITNIIIAQRRKKYLYK